MSASIRPALKCLCCCDRFPREVNLRVAVAEYQPFIQTNRDPINGDLLVTGPSYNLLNALADSLNFTLVQCLSLTGCIYCVYLCMSVSRSVCLLCYVMITFCILQYISITRRIIITRIISESDSFDLCCRIVEGDRTFCLPSRYTFVEGDDGLFGAPLPNGSWDGVIGLTLRGVSGQDMLPP